MRLLVSVRDVGEARSALAGGADLIDIKEPRRGALGAADPAVWREVIEEVGEKAPVSAALGELTEEGRERLAMIAGGLDYAKVGLAGTAESDWKEESWRRVVECLPAGVAHVAVCYVDWKSARAPTPIDVLACAENLAAAAVLFDTFDKRLGTLFDHSPLGELINLAGRCRDRGLQVVLGGSIDFKNLDRAMLLAPDIVAVRGAVCRPNRTGTVDKALVRDLGERLRTLSPV